MSVRSPSPLKCSRAPSKRPLPIPSKTAIGEVESDILGEVESDNREVGGLWEVPMRDWLMILVPIVVMFYFIMHPDQARPLMEWLKGLVY